MIEMMMGGGTIPSPPKFVISGDGIITDLKTFQTYSLPDYDVPPVSGNSNPLREIRAFSTCGKYFAQGYSYVLGSSGRAGYRIWDVSDYTNPTVHAELRGSNTYDRAPRGLVLSRNARYLSYLAVNLDLSPVMGAWYIEEVGVGNVLVETRSTSIDSAPANNRGRLCFTPDSRYAADTSSYSAGRLIYDLENNEFVSLSDMGVTGIGYNGVFAHPVTGNIILSDRAGSNADSFIIDLVEGRARQIDGIFAGRRHNFPLRVGGSDYSIFGYTNTSNRNTVSALEWNGSYETDPIIVELPQWYREAVSGLGIHYDQADNGSAMPITFATQSSVVVSTAGVSMTPWSAIEEVIPSLDGTGMRFPPTAYV